MARKSGEQRRSGHKRFKTSVKKALAAALQKAGFADGEFLFWKRDQHGNIQGVDFQLERNEWIVNVGFHFGFLPGISSWTQDPSHFGLTDFCLYWRPSGMGKHEHWIPLRDATEEATVSEAEAAIESLESHARQWTTPGILLDTISPDHLRSEHPKPWPSEWALWRHAIIWASNMALVFAAVAVREERRDLARQYAQVAVERTQYPWFRKRAEDILGEKL